MEIKEMVLACEETTTNVLNYTEANYSQQLFTFVSLFTEQPI